MDDGVTVELILARFRFLGVTLTPIGDRIRCRPASLVPPDLLDDLRQHKAEILKHLTTEAHSRARPAPAHPVRAAGARRTVSEAQLLLRQLLDGGSTFSLISEGREETLLWFGPHSSVTPEVRAQVTRLKFEMIALFQAGYPRSQRTWGEPQPGDWREPPDAESGR